METLELLQVQIEQIPTIWVDLTKGESFLVLKGVETESILSTGHPVLLVFDLTYSEEVFNGVGITTISIDNLKVRNLDGYAVPIDNTIEVVKALTLQKIQKK